MALPKPMRFATRASVGHVIRRGERIQTPLGGASVSPAPQGHTRMLVVVSTKVSKKSVRRNALKRLISEQLRRGAERISGAQIVLFVRPGVQDLAKKELLAAADQAIEVLARYRPYANRRIVRPA